MFTAKAECKRLEQTPHEGEEALALARLCSLGQDWDGTYSAARWYTRASAPAGEALHIDQGFALILQADLGVPIVRRALTDLREMNTRLPPTVETDAVFNYVLRALEITQPEAGLETAEMRQPQLLAIAAGEAGSAPALTAGTAEAEAWHILSLLHLAHRTADEQREREALQSAIAKRSSPLTAAESYGAARARAQYEWLGRPMPRMHVISQTYAAAKAPANHAAVQLLVIEREEAPGIEALGTAVDALRTRIQAPAEAKLVLIKAPAPDQLPVAKRTSATRTQHAMFTDENLLEQFSFGSGPLFVVIDAQGTVAYLGTGANTWLNPRMQAEVLIERVSSDKAQR